MNQYETFAFQCRQRAEELRAILPDMKDRYCRETVEKIILNYDNLAAAQEKLSRKEAPEER